MEPRVCNGALQRSPPSVDTAILATTTSTPTLEIVAGTPTVATSNNNNGSESPPATEAVQKSGNTGNFSGKKSTGEEKDTPGDKNVVNDTGVNVVNDIGVNDTGINDTVVNDTGVVCVNGLEGEKDPVAQATDDVTTSNSKILETNNELPAVSNNDVATTISNPASNSTSAASVSIATAVTTCSSNFVNSIPQTSQNSVCDNGGTSINNMVGSCTSQTSSVDTIVKTTTVISNAVSSDNNASNTIITTSNVASLNSLSTTTFSSASPITTPLVNENVPATTTCTINNTTTNSNNPSNSETSTSPVNDCDLRVDTTIVDSKELSIKIQDASSEQSTLSSSTTPLVSVSSEYNSENDRTKPSTLQQSVTKCDIPLETNSSRPVVSSPSINYSSGSNKLDVLVSTDNSATKDIRSIEQIPEVLQNALPQPVSPELINGSQSSPPVRKMSTDSECRLVIDETPVSNYDNVIQNNSVVIPKVSTPHTIWRPPTPQHDLHLMQNRSNSNPRTYVLPQETVVRSASYNNLTPVTSSYSAPMTSLKRPYEAIASMNAEQQNKMLYAQPTNNTQQKYSQNMYPVNKPQQQINRTNIQQPDMNDKQQQVMYNSNIIQHSYTKSPLSLSYPNQGQQSTPQPRQHSNYMNEPQQLTGVTNINRNNVSPATNNRTQPINVHQNQTVVQGSQLRHVEYNSQTVGHRTDQPSANNYHHIANNYHHNPQIPVSQTGANYVHRVDRSPAPNTSQPSGFNQTHHVSRIDNISARSAINHPQMNNTYGNMHRVDHSPVNSNSHMGAPHGIRSSTSNTQQMTRLDYPQTNRMNPSPSPVGQQYPQMHYQQQISNVNTSSASNRVLSGNVQVSKGRLEQSPHRTIDSHYNQQVTNMHGSTSQSPHNLVRPGPTTISPSQNVNTNYIPTSINNSQLRTNYKEQTVMGQPQRMVAENHHNAQGTAMNRLPMTNINRSQRTPELVNNSHTYYLDPQEQVNYPQKPSDHPSLDQQRQFSTLNPQPQRFAEGQISGVNQPMVIRKAPSSGGVATELHVEQLARPASLESDRSTPRSMHSQNTVIGSSTNNVSR